MSSMVAVKAVGGSTTGDTDRIRARAPRAAWSLLPPCPPGASVSANRRGWSLVLSACAGASWSVAGDTARGRVAWPVTSGGEGEGELPSEPVPPAPALAPAPSPSAAARRAARSDSTPAATTSPMLLKAVAVRCACADTRSPRRATTTGKVASAASPAAAARASDLAPARAAPWLAFPSLSMVFAALSPADVSASVTERADVATFAAASSQTLPSRPTESATDTPALLMCWPIAISTADSHAANAHTTIAMNSAEALTHLTPPPATASMAPALSRMRAWLTAAPIVRLRTGCHDVANAAFGPKGFVCGTTLR